MGLKFRKFKRSVKKTTALVVFIVLVCVSFVFHHWIIMQYQHCIAYYYVYKGDTAYKKAKLQIAINDYNRALSLYPDHIKAIYNLGNIYSVYEDYGSASNCYEKALNVDPNYVSARINLGIIMAEEFVSYDEAIDQYNRAINARIKKINIPYVFNNTTQITQNLASAYYNRGLAYKSKSLMFTDNPGAATEYLEKAAESYKKSLDYVSSSYDANYNLGLTYQLLDNYNGALEYYCRAITIDPLSYEAHYNMAILLSKRMNYKESMREIEKAGLILDSKGEGYKTRYIYQILSDINARAIAQKENSKPNFMNNVLGNNTPSEATHDDVELTYINGKVVPTEKLEKAIYDNMKTCNVCKFITEKK